MSHISPVRSLQSEKTHKSIGVVIPIYKDDVTAAALLQNLKAMAADKTNDKTKDKIIDKTNDKIIDEIIIVDGQARRDMPAHLALSLPQSLRAKLTWLAAAPKGRGTQIQAGILRAKADYIWVLHADSQLDKAAPHEIRRILAHPKISLGTFTLKFNMNGIKKGLGALSLFAWVSRMDSALTTFGDQGFFFRRADYAKLGLDLAQYPLLEDVALRRGLKSLGRIRRSAVPITTSARRFAKRGVWKTQIYNMQILWRYMRGESPVILYQDYYQAPPNYYQISKDSAAKAAQNQKTPVTT